MSALKNATKFESVNDLHDTSSSSSSSSSRISGDNSENNSQTIPRTSNLQESSPQKVSFLAFFFYLLQTTINKKTNKKINTVDLFKANIKILQDEIKNEDDISRLVILNVSINFK